jgi:carotenoid cleavage dioxygenase-like enzyme
LDLLPAGLGLASFSESLRWQPDRGTTLLVFDRHSLELVSRREVEPWFQWHFGNGDCAGSGPDAGQIVATMVRYEDFATNQFLREVASGRIETIAPGRLWELRIDPLTARLDACVPLGDHACEFPIEASGMTNSPGSQADTASATIRDRRTFVVTHRPGVKPGPELFGAIGVYHHGRNAWTIVDCGEDHYPFGPSYLSNPRDSTQEWLISIVFNGQAQRSELWILDGKSPDQDPICKLLLPEIIPFGFHGTWANST